MKNLEKFTLKNNSSHDSIKKDIFLDLVKIGQTRSVYGAVIGKSNDVIELTSNIVHKASSTTARFFTRVVLYDNAKILFKGHIKILDGISGCDSFLSLKVLLLGELCEVVASPILEIENNDVKCSHSVSISRPSEEELFYLMSRGMSRKSATSLIAKGFLNYSKNA